ncbi:subtilase-type protease inhibitor [Streptomyces glebosus]|uniref:Probable subtilase-type protease inhibitor n=1 Tax=Streptomyces glebosus TaxID=249580 RepID=A0A640T3I2_9ACTN|nr:subtilase-type protease inhibitor [Streptomyces glebosus]GFE17868.1 subtilase-type protease inhibitor [Streptomyces glebosus]GHG47366.1 subtilase-type protease inhibitor [Streptomyces glebosus]
MRYITGAVALGAALVLGTLATTAHAVAAPAQPARTGGLYAPTALVLTAGQGESRATATVQRAVTLSCMPGATGSHPNPKAACAELRTVAGDFNAVTTAPSDRLCTREWNPFVVTADGVWQGKRVSYTYTFANSCAMADGIGAVFDF